MARIEGPTHPFSQELLDARREAVLESIRPGIAIWAAGWDMGEADGDPKRQNSEFYHLTGLDQDEGWLVLVAPESGTDEVIFYADTSVLLIGYTLPAADVIGQADVRCMADGLTELPQLVEAEDSPARTGRLWLSDIVLEQSDSLVLSVIDTTGVWPGRTLDHLDATRYVKDPEALERLRAAIDMTGAALVAGMQATVPGSSEADLEAVIETSVRQAGAARMSFPSIVASGANALDYHYNTNDSVMEDGQFVVVDVGAEYGRYAADVTRTFPVSGKFSERQRSLYELLLGAHAAAVAEVRPGVTIRTLSDAAEDYLREMSGGLCGPASCFTYNYWVGHTLGLEVHDVGTSGSQLQEGAVITIEPGIYLRDEGIGMRIEDDYLVTATGVELLSTGIPRTVEEIEAAMAGGT